MSEVPAWERHRASLATQAGFVKSYSPLTAAMLECAVEWLGDPEARGRELGEVEAVRTACERLVSLLADDEVDGVDSGWIDDLKPALRLNAVLHWYVLQEDPRVAELRPYFSTVADGHGPGARKPSDDEFAPRLIRAVDALGEDLFERARDWRVVTNEASRGLAWLLPTVLVGAEAVHLVELGCSAGLNLYAEQRRYDLAWTASKRLRLGRAARDQFLSVCGGSMPSLEGFSDAERRGPDVLTRVGANHRDLNLDDPAFPGHLEACVWGDQWRRLDRLREGMAIHQQARETGASSGLQPARILSVDLPGELEEFLDQAAPTHPEVPIIVYNTCVTVTFSDVNERALARDMRAYARRWSLQHDLPWMWVRFEPPRVGAPRAPHPGWCRWVVELFSGAKHKTIELGWAHPHLIRAEFGPGVTQLRELRDRR